MVEGPHRGVVDQAALNAALATPVVNDGPAEPHLIHRTAATAPPEQTGTVLIARDQGQRKVAVPAINGRADVVSTGVQPKVLLARSGLTREAVPEGDPAKLQRRTAADGMAQQIDNGGAADGIGAGQNDQRDGNRQAEKDGAEPDPGAAGGGRKGGGEGKKPPVSGDQPTGDESGDNQHGEREDAEGMIEGKIVFDAAAGKEENTAHSEIRSKNGGNGEYSSQWGTANGEHTSLDQTAGGILRGLIGNDRKQTPRVIKPQKAEGISPIEAGRRRLEREKEERERLAAEKLAAEKPERDIRLTQIATGLTALLAKKATIEAQKETVSDTAGQGSRSEATQTQDIPHARPADASGSQELDTQVVEKRPGVKSGEGIIEARKGHTITLEELSRTPTKTERVTVALLRIQSRIDRASQRGKTYYPPSFVAIARAYDASEALVSRVASGLHFEAPYGRGYTPAKSRQANLSNEVTKSEKVALALFRIREAIEQSDKSGEVVISPSSKDIAQKFDVNESLVSQIAAELNMRVKGKKGQKDSKILILGKASPKTDLIRAEMLRLKELLRIAGETGEKITVPSKSQLARQLGASTSLVSDIAAEVDYNPTTEQTGRKGGGEKEALVRAEFMRLDAEKEKVEAAGGTFTPRSFSDIAADLNVSHQLVSNVASDMGRSAPSQKETGKTRKGVHTERLRAELRRIKEEMIAAQERGAAYDVPPFKDIAARTGAFPSVVSKEAKEMGIKPPSKNK